MGSTAATTEAAIEHLDRHGYLFGQKIAASMSPLMHGTIFAELGLKWEQLRLDSADIPRFLELIKDPRCFGSAVTMPNKVAIMPHLDEVTPECREVGACNTIFFREVPDPDPAGGGATRRRMLVGANTDVAGVREAFYRNVPGPDPASFFRGRPALVVGGGGAARSAVHALRRGMGAAPVYLVNRDDAEVAAVVRDCGYADGGDDGDDCLVHVRTPAQARALPPPAAVVACVPDFAPATEDERRAREVLEAFLSGDGGNGGEGEGEEGEEGRRKGALLEMCYNPSPHTQIAAIARREGWQVILGTEAMIWQGLEQAKLWTGREIEDLPIDKVKQVIAARLEQVSSSKKSI
ncbi:hypothetical protein F4809DRAFT_259487 [Biscogniauxia mediterranea]|nr:hypothetical protein F4809DRAFT_259487 [Biscogniauxia mediterranea]